MVLVINEMYILHTLYEFQYVNAEIKGTRKLKQTGGEVGILEQALFLTIFQNNS